ncbi:MAG: hypothetical protein GY899_11185 [Verrucomicrobiaceae bacterium]|nr:hypothetical protein [Verrucomicrobiaceae bacterium]
MNPGQINNVTPMPRPGEQPLEPAEFTDRSSEEITARERNKSRIMSLAIAGMVHVFLFLLLAWIVISNFQDDEVELILESTGQNLDASLQKRSFAKKVTQDKPAPPSRMAAKTIISNKVSAVVMPDVPDFTDLPAFGADHGDGFGMGGFGDGRGGARFFGTSGGGNRIILVIDTSTSMNGNCGEDGIKALRREIERTISSLPAQARFNILCFGNDVDGFASQPIASNSANVIRAKEWMKAYFINKKRGGSFDRTRTSQFGNKGRDNKGILYTPFPPSSVSSLRGTSGGSRMDLALVVAFMQKPSGIFLIADGVPGTQLGGRKLGNKQIVDLIQAEARNIYRNGPVPSVNCISVKGIGAEILKDIAKRFRGKYKAVDPAKV